METHPNSSLFHTVPWLTALERTFGYEAIVFSSSQPSESELADGLVCCRIDSRLTGRRLVSLPFSDHCEPLSSEPLELAVQTFDQRGADVQYFEVRPFHAEISPPPNCSVAQRSYGFHNLDLRLDLDSLWSGFHTSTRRNVRRAERAGLNYQSGTSDALLDHFYGIHLLTRRRHKIPPFPKVWFRNLIDLFGDAIQIRVALRGSECVAAILTLTFRDTITYKYGGFRETNPSLGGMHLLFWKTIGEAKSAGLKNFDLGRSDLDQLGLITFKDRLGASRKNLTYTRFLRVPASTSKRASDFDPALKFAGRLIPLMPDFLFRKAGELLYRHFG